MRRIALVLWAPVFALLGACADDRPGVLTDGDGGIIRPGAYSEPLCADPLPSLDAVRATYRSPADLRAAVEGIARVRYPNGLELIRSQSDDILPRWFRSQETFDDLLDGFEVAVHEGGHLWDFSNSPRGQHSFRLRDDLIITTQYLDNYPRSEIKARHVDLATDFYDSVYLEGASGMQGFTNLLDEVVMYTHSLAAKYCTRDAIPDGGSTSAKDGILTFMYYMALYLKGARLDHPDDYAEIIGDPGHIELITTVWDRAEFLLSKAAPFRQLGLREATLRGWVDDPEIKDEIARIRRLR